MTVVVSLARQRREERDQATLQADVDVRKLVLDAVAEASPNLRIDNSLVSGEVLRTIQGASQVSVIVHDQARGIFKSGVLVDDDDDLKAVDIHLDGLWYRLVKVQKQGDDVVLTFEDRDVSYLRDKKGPRKLGSRRAGSSKKGVTRAEAILMLLRSVKIHQIPARINELHKNQPIAKLTDSERENRRKGTGGGNRGAVDNKILVVGDSLAVGAATDFKKNMGSSWKVTSDAKVGRSTSQGLAVLKSVGAANLPGTVILQLGTNDDASAPAAFADKVEEIMDYIPDDRRVFWVNLYRATPMVSFTDLNEVLEDQAAHYDNLTIIRWAKEVSKRHLEMDSTYRVHPTATGYKVRAALIADEVGSAGIGTKYAGVEDNSTENRDRTPGFGDSSVSGVSQKQLRVIAQCLEVAEELKVTERVKLAMLVAGFGESGFDPSQVDFDTGTHKGVFQSNQIPQYDTRQQAKYFLLGGRSFRNGAIKTVREHQTWTVGAVAEYVEVSGAGAAHYDQYFRLARRILDAWGGSNGNFDNSYRKQYAFRVDNGETYWDAIQRFADVVNWRAFFSDGIFYYISEEDLFAGKPKYVMSESMPGVINIDFDQDKRKKVNRATATVRVNRWAIPPGTIVRLEDLGPANGKWLVESVTRNLFSSEATVELRKPKSEKLEPRTEEVKRKKKKGGPGGDPDGAVSDGNLGARCYDIAKDIGSKHYPYVWGGGHAKAGHPDTGTPGSSSHDGTSDSTAKGFDCSGGAAAVLKRAGAWPESWETGVPDSGTISRSYGEPGEGKTCTVWANGTHVFIEVKVDGHRYHLGTGRWGTDFGGYGVKPQLHPHSGFVARHWPERDARPGDGNVGPGHDWTP